MHSCYAVANYAYLTHNFILHMGNCRLLHIIVRYTRLSIHSRWRRGCYTLFHWISLIHVMIKLSLCMPWSHTRHWMASLTFTPGTRWRWVVGFTPRPIYPPPSRGKYALNTRLGWPRSRFGVSPTSSPINELHRLPRKRQSTTHSHHDNHGTTAWCGRYITHWRTEPTFKLSN